MFNTLVDAPFSDEEKAVRLRFCYKYVDMPEDFWLRVVWVDEASLLLEPQPQPAVGERGTVVVITDSRKKHHRYGCPHLNFCLAVNGYAGLVFHGFIHTTTGWSGKEYRVGKQPLTFALKLAVLCCTWLSLQVSSNPPKHSKTA